MEIVALLFAAAALLCFLLEVPIPTRPRRVQVVPLGLALLVCAWVAQTVVAKGWHWTIR